MEFRISNVGLSIVLSFLSVCGWAQDTISFHQLEYEHRGLTRPEGYFYFGNAAYTGTAMDTFPNGRTRQLGCYVHGLLHGTYRSWYASGQMRQQQGYHRGMRVDSLIYWYENGQRMSVSKYHLNMPYDTMWKWYEDGTLKFLEYQALGDTIVRYFDHYYPSGQKKYEVRPCYQLKWHENGRLAEKGCLEDNRPVGRWKYWSEKGKLLEKKRYPKRVK